MDANRVFRENKSMDEFENRRQFQTPPSLKLPKLQKITPESKSKIHSFSQFQEELQSVTSTLSSLSDTIGSALEESYNLGNSQRALQEQPVNINVDPKKQPQEMAISMASKAKLLFRELKAAKADLVRMKERILQLEEENARLYNSFDKNLAPDEEEDLVRQQLEALLAEKARLVQENVAYKRETQLLHEVIDYHQLTMERSFATSTNQ